MTELVIENGLVIDDVESVLCGIQNLSGRPAADISVIRKFIINEKNTRFYVDASLNSYMQPEAACVYAWLDSGYVDRKGNPIFISLLRSGQSYIGHVTGTINTLAANAKKYFKLKTSLADRKISVLKSKYQNKAKERKNRQISDEREYLLTSINGEAGPSDFALKIMNLGIQFAEDDEAGENLNAEKKLGTEANPGEKDNSGMEVGSGIKGKWSPNGTGADLAPEKTASVVDSFASALDFTAEEQEITVGLLLEKMEDMQNYMDELLHRLEEITRESQTQMQESQSQIQDLQAKNDEYRRAIVQMRLFTQQEESASQEKAESMDDEANTNKGISSHGHKLLGSHSKILVIGGSALGVNIMQGIAKTYGFQNDDFDFIDYDKAKSYADRVRCNGRYRAVIFGECPHKTAGSAGYSSVLEMFRHTAGMPYTADARSKSGKLKVTKESFKEALTGVCTNLQLASA